MSIARYPMPFLMGHRGASAYAPENTLASFLKAHEMGVNWVEFDVKLTADNRPVIFHDETLERTTDGMGDMAMTTLDVLAGFSAGIMFHKDFVAEAVPTLEEGLDLLADLGMGCNIELKPCPGREEETARIALDIAQAVVGSGWPPAAPRPLISSFSPICMAVAAEVASDWPRAYLTEQLPRDWPTQIERFKCQAVHLDHHKLTKKQVQLLQEAGLAVAAWTVNRPERATELYGWGVDCIISDVPDKIVVPQTS